MVWGILPGMDVIETTPEGEPKRDSRGRKVLSASERERLLAEYDRSGLTQKEFCRREGVNYHTFVSWLGHRRKGGGESKSSPEGKRFVEMMVPFAETTSESRFEVDLGGGIVVRTADEAALWRLIEHIRG